MKSFYQKIKITFLIIFFITTLISGLSAARGKISKINHTQSSILDMNQPESYQGFQENLPTGLDAGHPDFAGRVVAGASFVGGDYGDENGHGTHVASISAGDGSVLGGKYRGVAPEAPRLKFDPIPIGSY